MSLASISVKRPVAITMVFFIVILLGWVSMSKLNMDLLPELNLPMAMALTTYEGVGPEEIENLLTRPIEGALGTVNGIKNINSTSSQGSSMIMVELAWGTDMNFAINQMREKIDLVERYLPEDAAKTTLFKLDPNMMPMMVLGFGGNLNMDTIDRLANDVVKPRLERVNGVASVTVTGSVDREIRISAVPQKLLAYGLTLDRIVSYLRMENRNVSGGTVEEGLKEHVIRVTGEFTRLEDIENIQLPLDSGGYIRLADITRVEDTYKDQKQIVFMNGVPSVQISVQRQTDANTVKVSDAVHKEIEDIIKALPTEAEILVGFDQARFIRESINNVTRNAFTGGILAILVLLLFLRNIRSTMIISTAIPISVIGTFVLMYFGGVTLNLVSIGGLALGVGMVVDNAIVILENIYRYRQEGYSRVEAAVIGANEVSTAITASTLTTVVVFLPIVFVEGLASQIFRPMALTVTFSLVASLFVALTLLPMLCSRFLKVDRGNSGQVADESGLRPISRLSDRWGVLMTQVEQGYRGLLVRALSHKKKIVLGVFALLLACLVLIPLVGMEFLPEQDSGEYIINIQLPNGTALEETKRVTERVEDFVKELPEYEWAFYAIGSSGNMFFGGSASEMAVIQGKIVEKRKRKRSIDQVMDELRVKCAGIPGAKIEISRSGGFTFSSGTPINVSLSGDNLEVLQAVSDTMAERIKTIPGTREVKTSLEDGKPEIHIKLNREKADLYGLNFAQVSGLVATAFNGSIATRYRIKGEEMDVRVILDQDYRQNLWDIGALTLVSQTGAQIPIGEVADLEITTGPIGINRVNQTRTVSITGDVSGRDVNSVTRDIQKAVRDIQYPAGVQLEFGGAFQDMMESFISLAWALVLAIILVYMILAAQYESFLYPFIIMFAMPPIIVGVIFSLWVTGRTLNVASFIGIIMLAGIVVNNAIVLVDYINTLRTRDGFSRDEAILKAGPTRLRPILMTTLTTLLGLVPLVLGLGEGAELAAPMATVVFGGLTFSTVITLVLVPCMYILLEDMVQKISISIKKLGTKLSTRFKKKRLQS